MNKYRINTEKEKLMDDIHWIRRGHTRKPNWIVCFLYGIFDKIADFKPMFSKLFGFLGRTSLVVANLVILAGVIITSAAHSLELLRYAGLDGIFAWIGLIIWELGFIFCSIELADVFKSGKKWYASFRNWVVLIGFVLCFAFVELSNILGMNPNWIGFAIGVCTPLQILIFKGILVRRAQKKKVIVNWYRQEIAHEDAHEDAHKYSYAHAHTAQDSSAQVKELEDAHTQNAQVGAQKESAQNEVAQDEHAQTSNAQIEENAHTSTHAQNKDVQVGAQENAQGSSAQIEQLAQKEDVHNAHAQNFDAQVTQDANTQNAQNDDAQGAHAQNSDTQNICAQNAQDEQEAHAQKESAQNEYAHEQEISQNDEVAQKENVHKSAQDSNAQIAHDQDAHIQDGNDAHEDINAQSAHVQDKYAKLLASVQKEEIRLAMIRAIEYEQEHKEFPKINELAELAGVTPWYARVALNTLQGKPTRRTKKKAV